MSIELIVILAVAALLIFLIATHKIDLTKLKGELSTELAKLHAKQDATHQAVLAPVSVTTIPVAPAAPAAQAEPPPAPPATPEALTADTAPPPGSPAANASDFTRRWLASGDARGANAGGNVDSAISTPSVDRWSGALDFAPSSIQFWKGGAGDVTALPVKVPAGWRGKLEVMAGESPEAGPKVNQFDLWVSTVPKQEGPSNWPRFDRGPYGSILLPIEQDVGTIYVNVHQWQPGGGFVQLNPQAAA